MVIRLICMPFGPLHYPSIGLTQLRSVVEERFGNRVEVHLHYLNHDFGQLLGTDLYNSFCHSAEAQDHVFGDWLFRRTAFPDAADNTESLFDKLPESEQESVRHSYETIIKPYHDGIPAFLEQMMERYHLAEAHLVGFSSMFAQNLATIAMANTIRRHNPDIFQIMGGANCEFPMGLEFLHHLDCFDAVASGSGLVSFPDLVQHIMDGNESQIHHINGIFTVENSQTAANLPLHSPLRNRSEALLKNGIKPAGDDRPLDLVPELNYDGFMAGYERLFAEKLGKPFVTFETSRGCWWGEKSQCVFCGLNGNSIGYRCMSDDVVLKHMRDLTSRYMHRVSHYECVDNIMPRHYAKDVLPKLDPPDGINFYWEVRADLDTQDLEGLAKAHVMEIQPGVEALNTKSLQLMRKGIRAFTNVRLLRDATMYDISVLWYLMLGFPGEETEVYQKYIDDFPRLVHLEPPVSAMEVEFHRFSSYFQNQEEFGLRLEPDDFYYLHFPFSKEVIAGMAYYFKDVQGTSGEGQQSETGESTSRFAVPPALYEAIENRLDYWQRRFRGSDGLLKASLFYHSRETSRIVVDTRDGSRQEYRLTKLEHRMAKFLDQPRQLSALYAAFSDYSETDLTAALGQLDEHYKLLFKENDTYLSLVPQKRKVAS